MLNQIDTRATVEYRMNTSCTAFLENHHKICIRPICRDDIERERRFIEGLSTQTRYMRFLGGVGQLTGDQLARLCDVDQVHDMAFVAMEAEDSDDQLIGVARYVADADAREAEIAITVADDWQDKGIDEVLLSHLVDYARSMNIEALYSIDLPANTHMQSLATRFGFTSAHDPDDARLLVHRLQIGPGEARRNTS